MAIASPANNTAFAVPGGLTVDVAASDADGSVAKVELFDSGRLVGTSAAAPYRFTLASAGAGAHVLSARATDNEGLFTDSGTVLAFGRSSTNFALVDNFEGRALAPILFQGEWLGVFNGDSVRMDPTSFEGGNPSNKVLRLATRNQSLSYPLLVPEGEKATLFFRASSTTWSRDDVSLGLADRPAYGYSSASDFEVQMGRWTGESLGNRSVCLYDGGTSLTDVDVFESDVWYRFWAVVDNASDTWGLYVQGGDYTVPTRVDREDDGGTVFGFRNGSDTLPLARFLIRSPVQGVWNGAEGGFWLDDIYLASGLNLSDPTLIPPTPPSLSIVRSGDTVTIAWPVSGSSAVLQSTPGLSPAAWSDVGATPVATGDSLSVTQPIGVGEKYYRLR